jgi:predicted HTH transcriptional regulator
MHYPTKDHLISRLQESLSPVPRELDDLDWKLDLSPNKTRIAHHLSAFSNRAEGGYLVFGVNDKGQPIGISGSQIEAILQQLGNIARDGLEPCPDISHDVVEFSGKPLLFVKIDESPTKPVHLKGKAITESFIRFAGTTRKTNPNELRKLLINSTNPVFEKRIALKGVTPTELKTLLNVRTYADLSGKPNPSSLEDALSQMAGDGLLIPVGARFDVTNLGAILFARDLNKFEDLANKGTRIIVYSTPGNSRAIKNRQAKLGYAVGLNKLLNYLLDLLPENEVMKAATRTQVKMYPELALRELLANALIHQDFEATGTQPRIEIYPDRLVISNPGRPLIEPLRMIDGCQSRNERLAWLMNKLGFCEERGRGIDLVIGQVEEYQLPPPEITQSQTHTTVTLFASRPLTKMAKQDRIRACYQHCCLRHEHNEKTNNRSVRERFKISEKNKPQASRIISDTVEAGMILPQNPESKAKKFSNYIPYWAADKNRKRK